MSQPSNTLTPWVEREREAERKTRENKTKYTHRKRHINNGIVDSFLRFREMHAKKEKDRTIVKYIQNERHYIYF